jgi:hypothetical protein
MKNGMWTLAEAAIKVKAFESNIKYATESILTDWAVTVRNKAKAVIGEYQPGWPELARKVRSQKRDTIGRC